MLIVNIQEAFNKKLSSTFGSKPDVLRYLMNHPNRLHSIENLNTQIRIAELNPKIKFNQDKIKDLAEGVAMMYAQAAIGAKEQELRTDQQRMEARKKQEMENFASDLDEGIKELGITEAFR